MGQLRRGSVGIGGKPGEFCGAESRYRQIGWLSAPPLGFEIRFLTSPHIRRGKLRACPESGDKRSGEHSQRDAQWHCYWCPQSIEIVIIMMAIGDTPPGRRAAIGVQAPYALLEAGRTRLALKRQGAGLQVICLHATGHGGRDFEPFAKVMAAKGFETISWIGQVRAQARGAMPICSKTWCPWSARRVSNRSF